MGKKEEKVGGEAANVPPQHLPTARLPDAHMFYPLRRLLLKPDALQQAPLLPPLQVLQLFRPPLQNQLQDHDHLRYRFTLPPSARVLIQSVADLQALLKPRLLLQF